MVLISRGLLGDIQLFQTIVNTCTSLKSHVYMYYLDLALQYCHLLHENASYMRPIEQAFCSFHDTIKEDSLITLVSSGSEGIENG